MTINQPSASNGSEGASGDAATPFKIWQCILCGFVYEEAEGLPAEGIPAGTRWVDVPNDWICPECSATKIDFEMIEI